MGAEGDTIKEAQHLARSS